MKIAIGVAAVIGVIFLVAALTIPKTSLAVTLLVRSFGACEASALGAELLERLL